MPKVALTEREVVDTIPKFYRQKERREHLAKMGRALPTIAETNKTPIMVRVDKTSPGVILSKPTRVKTNAPSYHIKFDDRKEVIGQEEAKKAVKAVKSGVPLAVPRVRDGKSKNPIVINEGITSARQAAPGRTRRRDGGKKKRHRTKKRRRKRRKHFKGGLFERPGIGIKAGLFPVRIKTENSTDDTKTWDPCWKVSTRANRGWIVDKGMESRVVPTKEIKPQGMRSKKQCYISGGKRKKTHRRKKHKRRRRRRTHKK